MKKAFRFGRDFGIMILGQIISLFGNSVLRFALSLYVLEVTGSAAVFGGILAVAMIPTVLLSPVGGVLADRLPKQRIMVILDFSTAAFILLFDLFFTRSSNLAAVTGLMILLSLIQAVYQPSVQASIPLLADDDRLMAANGAVLQVQALAGLLGPVIGGLLYGFLGLAPILLSSCVCFFLSAVMELFLRIPHIPKARTAPPLIEAGRDLREALGFLTRDKPNLFRLLLIIAGINLFLSALFTVGLPFIVKIHLGLSSQLYGFAEAALGLGSILGGICSGLAAGKLSFRQSHRYLLLTTVLLLPIVGSLAVGANALVSYGILLFSVVLGMGCAALFNITAQTFVQRETPARLLGKVGSFISTICICALPVGQAMYGMLFQVFHDIPWTILLFGCAVTLVLVFFTKTALKTAAG